MELFCWRRYFDFVVLCLIASLLKKRKKMGSTVKPNMYLYSFTFYLTWSTWLGKLIFSSFRTKKRIIFLFSSSCAWSTENFSLPFLVKDTCFGTLHWKWKAFLIIPLLCLFLILPTMFMDKTLPVTFFESKHILWNVAVPLRLQLYENFAVLLVRSF